MALVPIGAVLMGLFSFDLALLTSSSHARPCTSGMSDVLASFSGLRMLFDFAGLAFAGGLFIVPSFAAVQAWAPVDRRARVIAGCNVM